jgi:hypothetical protein
MNRAHVKLLALVSLLLAAVCWAAGYARHGHSTPAEESLRQQYLALADYQRTNTFAVERRTLLPLAQSQGSLTNADQVTAEAARQMANTIYQADADDSAALQDLYHQQLALWDARDLARSRFNHVAEFFLAAALLFSLLLFITAPPKPTPPKTV